MPAVSGSAPRRQVKPVSSLLGLDKLSKSVNFVMETISNSCVLMKENFETLFYIMKRYGESSPFLTGQPVSLSTTLEVTQVKKEIIEQE